MARFLDELALRFGLPEEIVLDNGPEGTGKAMFNWSERTGVRLRFVEPGKPVQNAFVESLNGKLRDECLNLHWFSSLRHGKRDLAPTFSLCVAGADVTPVAHPSATGSSRRLVPTGFSV